MISHPAQSSNEIKGLNKRLVTLKLLQEDIETIFQDIGIGKDFLKNT